MQNKEEEINQWLNGNPLSISIFNKKYRHNNESLEEFFKRVTGNNPKVIELLKAKKFCYGGRVLANRGIEGRKVSLSNCYVITPPEDNKQDIFRSIMEIAETFSYGGGCGIDLSQLRPRGATVHNAALESTGPVSFMNVYSEVTGTIAQQGRRGALMISLDVNHPDIEEFIDCKTVANKIEFANISVRVNDDFMKAVEKNDIYFLTFPCDKKLTLSPDDYEFNKLYQAEDGTYFKKVKAKQLFIKLAKNNWDWAEPGILYWDRIKDYNMLNTNPDFEFAGVNPCAEEPLPANGSCNLGSLNLSMYVSNPFTFDARIEYAQLMQDTEIAVDALNEVLLEGIYRHPLKAQQDIIKDWRQIGLGVMGVGEMLIKLGIAYDSQRAVEILNDVMRTIAVSAVAQSCAWAEKYGCYPKCTSTADILESSFIKGISINDYVAKKIDEVGMFNSQLLTCAPTGSIATMFQTSTGVEPYFNFSYKRLTKTLEGKDTSFEVNEKVVDDYQKVTGKSYKDNPIFVCSETINPKMRVTIQATLQKYIDASISSTVNLPHTAAVDQIADLYLDSWKQGLKGLTIFRSGCARSPILSTAPKQENTQELKLNSIVPFKRKDLNRFLPGISSRWKCACGTLHITINRADDGNFVEFFINSSKTGTCKANLNGLTRMISTCLRAGVKLDEVIDQLTGIQCPACASCKARGIKVDGTSCPDIMAKALKQTYKYLNSKKPATEEEKESNAYEECPECHQKTLIRTGGCKTCTSCGYSKCDI